MRTVLFALGLLVGASNVSSAHLWQVGPTRAFVAPSQVASIVAAGDTVEIDAGTYDDCATWSASNLLLRGVGGRPHLQNKTCSNKGIWILFGNHTTIENIEFSGAVSSDWNGAGVRAQGGSFTMRDCFVHHNQMGVLSSLTDTSNVLIERCVFNANISPNEALFAHNIYINNCDTFTLRYCYVHGAQVGHEVKSRARVNFILYNRITNEADSASRDIDLPNGGQAFVMGNMIEKGPNAANTNTLGFGLEGMTNPGPQNLYVVNNTFINDLPSRGIYFTLPSTGVDTLLTRNNIFAGTGVLLNGSPHVIDSATNLFTADISSVGLVDPANFDYHLANGSSAIGAGGPAGFARGFSLTPEFEYSDTAQSVARVHLKSRPIALGAFEYNPPLSVRLSNKPSHFIAAYRRESAVISVTLPAGEYKGKLIVYDELGRQIATVEPRNTEHVEFSTNEFANGVYFVRLSAGSTSMVTPVLVMP